MPSKKDMLEEALAHVDMDRLERYCVSIDDKIYDGCSLISRILLECRECNNDY